MEYKFNLSNFKNEVLESDVPVLIDFYADWCGPCKSMGPVVASMAEKYDGKIKVGKINVDEERELAEQFGVMSIPNFIFIKNGKVVDQAIGAMPAPMLEGKIESLIK